jgi:hypothetical protein
MRPKRVRTRGPLRQDRRIRYRVRLRENANGNSNLDLFKPDLDLEKPEGISPAILRSAVRGEPHVRNECKREWRR